MRLAPKPICNSSLRRASFDFLKFADVSRKTYFLGIINHSSANTKIQVQEEVLLNSGSLKQVSEPIPIMENGLQKTVDGMKFYYVDFIETF